MRGGGEEQLPMGGQVVLGACADRPGSKPPAVAFDAIELDGSCHGSRVLLMGIWRITVTVSNFPLAGGLTVIRRSRCFLC